MCPLIPSYSFSFFVKVQHVLHILLAQLVINPSNITTWHAFLPFHMVRPICITSSWFSYTWVWSSYFRCSSGFFGICGVLHIRIVLKGPQHSHEPSYAYRSLSNFYNVFPLLWPTIRLLTTYCISITKYLTMLYWVWCSYYIYIGKVVWAKILWHYNGPFGLSLGHYSCFFKEVGPSLNGSTCWPCLLKVLGFDRSCIILSFSTRWSPYSSWCDGTCRD